MHARAQSEPSPFRARLRMRRLDCTCPRILRSSTRRPPASRDSPGRRNGQSFRFHKCARGRTLRAAQGRGALVASCPTSILREPHRFCTQPRTHAGSFQRPTPSSRQAAGFADDPACAHPRARRPLALRLAVLSAGALSPPRGETHARDAQRTPARRAGFGSAKSSAWNVSGAAASSRRRCLACVCVPWARPRSVRAFA